MASVRPTAAVGHMPFPGHGTCADWMPPPKRWCSQCGTHQPEPCDWAMCGLLDSSASHLFSTNPTEL